MPVWNRSEKGRSHALIITKLGRTAIEAEDDGESEDSDPGVQTSASIDKLTSERSTPRKGNKLSIVIDLLARKRGAGIEELASTSAGCRTPRAPLRRDCASAATRSNASALKRAVRSTGSRRVLHPFLRPEAIGEAQSRQPVATPAAQTLKAELDRIAPLSLNEVRALRREMTQHNAPKALSRDLLPRMIAYQVQEQRLGKLGCEMRKLLDRLAKGGTESVRHLKVGNRDGV